MVWDDISYTIVAPSIWTNVEQSMGIICACLSTLRPLLSRALPGLTRSFKNSTTDPKRPRKSNESILLPDLKVEDSRKGLTRQRSWPKGKIGGETACTFEQSGAGKDIRYAPGESWIHTDVSRASDPDLEALSEDYRNAIVMNRSFEQSYSHT